MTLSWGRITVLTIEPRDWVDGALAVDGLCEVGVYEFSFSTINWLVKTGPPFDPFVALSI